MQRAARAAASPWVTATTAATGPQEARPGAAKGGHAAHARAST